MSRRKKRAPWGVRAAELRAAEFIACVMSSSVRCRCSYGKRHDLVELMATDITRAYWSVD